MLPRILIIDDDAPMRFFLAEAMRKEGYACDEAASGREGLEKLGRGDTPVVLLDLKMPGMGGLEVLKEIRRIDPEAPVLIVTAFGTKDAALEAVRQGAYDFFTKPVDLEEMRVVVRRAVERARLQVEVRALREEVLSLSPFEGLVGESRPMREVFALIHRVAESDVTVLITGESGTGKELVARTIHAQSGRASGPFIQVNCAAIPETLLEAELFGHEKGAFTGADRQRTGKFEAADGGTIFLDEIGDMSLAMQAKTLRVLQEHAFERVGGTKTVRSDFRLIAATNKDLLKAAQEGQFREDLYYRLHVVPIRLPPLRERLEDLPHLVDFLLRRYGEKLGKAIREVSPEVFRLFYDYPWPGNVRELENVIQRGMVLAKGDAIQEEDVADALQQGTGALETRATLSNAVEEREKAILLEALQRHRWRRQEAAEALGITRRTLFNKMKKYGLA